MAANLNPADVRQRFEKIAGVSRVEIKDSRDSLAVVEVESLAGQSVRPELARAVVQAGWNLHEMRGINMSLEDIFLQLTGGASQPLETPVDQPVEVPVAGEKK